MDRFSDKAAHLQLRTPENHLPGPNEPVDFDSGPFITQGLSPSTGKPVRYYNFDVQTTMPAPVYVLYREGEDKPVDGQLDIIDTLPGEKGYNDFRQVWKVTVAKDYVANTIVDAAALHRRRLQDGADAGPAEHAGRARQVAGKGAPKRAKAPSCIAAGTGAKWRNSSASTRLPCRAANVPLSPIYVTFNVNPGQPNGGPGSGFHTEPGSEQTHNVPATQPGDPGYSPLWLVAVYDNADFPSVHDLKTALKAKVLAAGVATVNCPIVFIEP